MQTKTESNVSERELREAVEVRIGLVADKNLRRVLRAFFADKERADAFFTLPARLHGAHAYARGLAEETVEVSRIVGAAAASIPGVDRDLVTAAALLSLSGATLAFKRQGDWYEHAEVGELFTIDVLSGEVIRRVAREASGIPPEVVDRLVAAILGVKSTPESSVLHHAQEMSKRAAFATGRGLW